MLTTGSTFGPFNIGELLGSGAMGVVYKATDTRTNEIVALKLIDDSSPKFPDYRKRLEKEADAAGKIDSPFIIKIREYSEVNNIPYLSMEYAPGNELRDEMESLNFDQKIDIIYQIGEGLKSAHTNNLIHRDLKPENIKIDNNGKIKILDFGLAKIVSADSVDQFGDIEGTLYYLSPEQITGDSLSYTTDLFSYGIIIYEMLSGRKPFDGDYPAAIIYSILHEEPPLPSDIRNDLPKWCDELIMKLLKKRIENRFENINVVLDFIKTSLAIKKEKTKIQSYKAKRTLTIIDLKNLSGDESWNYFCIGFTDDLVREISRRTDLVVSSEPASEFSRNIREAFHHYRSNFVIVGSLMKWQDRIKLGLSIYASNGDKMLFGNNYETESKDLFNIMTEAVDDAVDTLSQVTDLGAVDVEEYFNTDIAAYEYYLKGKNYYQTNKPDDLKIAEEMFKKSLQIDPDLAHAYSGLSDVYSFEYMAYYDRSQEKIESAREQAFKALEISPNLPEAHRSLGRYYMFIGAMKSAEESFLKSIEINPKYAIGYRTIAWLKEIAAEHENAIYWAKQSLRNAPNDLETLLLLGLSNMHLAKNTVAMATLQRAIELAPDYGRAHYNLGRIYLKLGVLEQALESFLKAIAYKGDPNAYIDAAYIYYLNNDLDKARELYLESVKSGFFPFIAQYFLGYLERNCGNEKEAIKYFVEANNTAKEYESKDPRNPHIKAFQAITFASMGEPEQALSILDNLQETNFYDGEMLYNIARAYALLGKNKKANELLEMALKKHPGPTEKEINIDPHFKNIKFDFNDL